VDGDEVELGDGHVWVRDGERFTGTAVDRFPDGSLLGETEYRDGVPDGLSRTYWRGGGLRIEDWHVYGVRVRSRHWYETGQLAEDTVTDERGAVVRLVRYDEDGTLVDWHPRV
jgi:antitoxin component YwqK of YwqJK toxin-antitoxin module